MEKSDTITEVNFGKRKFILIGTAHISQKSADEVEQVIREEQPDRVCIEIDAARYKSMTEGNSWKNLNIAQVIRQGRGFLLLANLVLSSFQRRMGENLGVKQGGEMRVAVNVSDELNIPYTFADREVQITLRRAWGRANFFNKMKLLASLIGSAFTKEKLTEEELEELKRGTALDDMMKELSDILPPVKDVLIDERDRFLATKIYTSKGDKVVAVVGAAHVPGIVRHMEKLEKGELSSSLDDINEAPPKKKIGRIIGWCIPVIIVGLIAFGIYRNGWERGLNMFLVWIVVNGGLSGLGALIALGHPLTILLCIASAPFTSLVPVIGVGFLSGPTEALLRKPRVIDFENVMDDIKTFKGFYRNRLTRILLVFFFSTLGSAIGTFIGFPYLSAVLIK